ncbi:MAG: 30S ribosome-binding factor RbfA [Dongiaceae bacterium]
MSRARQPSARQLRVGEELRHALVEILRRGELRDPELQSAMVTVTEVRVSPDLRAATAFVVPFGGGDLAALVKALNHAAPFLRGRLVRAVQLRLAPTLHFEPDRSFEAARRIETLLHDPAVARDLGPPDEAADEDEPERGGPAADDGPEGGRGS